MGNFRDNRGTSGFGRDGAISGGRRFSGGNNRSRGFKNRSFGDRDSGFSDRPREMHEATCDKCGKQCKVPFRPSGGKPIYCSDCFRNSGGSDSRGSDSRESFSSRREERGAPSGAGGGISQEQFKQLNTKLDKILSVLEQLEIEVDDGEDEDEEFEDDDEDSEEDVKDAKDDSKDE